jgi:hypothetical protein
MKATRKAAKKSTDGNISPSKATFAVARFLLKNCPREAAIASGMEQAATGKSLKRKLNRIRVSVASESASASAAA